MDESRRDATTDAATGIVGLDDILCGGFPPDRLYLIEGVPGSGKTTLALQFLIEGARGGKPMLYVTLSETEEELRAVAATHGWSLEGITIQELVPAEESLKPAQQYTMFHPSEVELSETTNRILEDVERIKPARIVLDSLSELRLLAGSALRFRRQLLALKQYFRGRNCTVLLLDDLVGDRDLQVQSIAHGVIVLSRQVPEFGGERRRLQVLKIRGRRYRGGLHDYAIRTGGLEVFPRLVAAEHRAEHGARRISSGLAELDTLLGGGIEEGTSTLILGAPGTGKSTIAALFATAAAQRGEKAALFIFDESSNTLFARTESLGIPLREQQEAGRIVVRPVDPAELSPGEFTHAIRRCVEIDNARVVVIDSLNGYLSAMPGERFLTLHLHELLMYLGQRGVATILVGAQQGLIGSQMVSSVDATYLADAVILMRYFEMRGEVRQSISIVKKRGGDHERSIREFRMDAGRLHVSEPLKDFRGVLTGTPIQESAPQKAAE